MEDSGGSSASTLPLVRADPRWLRELLDNVLENAVKYSPEGGPIEIVLRAPPPSAAPGTSDGTPAHDQPMVEMRLRDEGLGIPTDHLGRIFDRFHRVDTRLTREGEGLGLGLAVCKRIVELHEGAIWAESAGDTGSTFHTLLLTLLDEPMDAQGDVHKAADEER